MEAFGVLQQSLAGLDHLKGDGHVVHIGLRFPRREKKRLPTIKPGAVSVWLLGFSTQGGLRKTSCYYGPVGGCGLLNCTYSS